MSVLVKPSSLIPKGLRVQQINNLTLFKFTDELGDQMQTLLDKKKADDLTPEEVLELEAIGELDQIFSYINAVIAARVNGVIPKSLHHIVRQRARFQCEYCHYPELLSDALTLFLHWRKSCYIMGCGSSLLGMIRSGGINRSNVFLCKGFILYNPPPFHNTNRRA